MDSNWNNEEQAIISLLGELKSATPEYPHEMLTKRRVAFIASIASAAVGGAVAAKTAGHVAAEIVKSGLTQVDKVILGVKILAVAGLATYAGVTAYVHRDEIKDLLFPSPTVSSVTAVPASAEPIIATETPLPTITPQSTSTPTLKPTGTATLTPTVENSSTLTAEQPSRQSPTSTGPASAPSTSEPPTEPPPPSEHPGLHLGQTKTPKP